MNAWHQVARCRQPFAPLLQAQAAFWLWDRLRRLAPSPLAVVLMPNHLHLLVQHGEPAELTEALGKTLGHWRRRFGPEGFGWEPLPAPEHVRGRAKVLRTVRYIALNPCRAGLCRDPLEWVASTHRDAVGAVARPWCDREALRAGLPVRGGHEERASVHAWVSGDPSVDVAGTPAPRLAAPAPVADRPLADAARAAAAAMRGLPGDIRLRGATRNLFVQLALRNGWSDTRVLARACSASVRTIERIRRRELEPQVLEAGGLCLSDDRLRGLGGLEVADEWSLSRPEGRRRVASVAEGDVQEGCGPQGR